MTIFLKKSISRAVPRVKLENSIPKQAWGEKISWKILDTDYFSKANFNTASSTNQINGSVARDILQICPEIVFFFLKGGMLVKGAKGQRLTKQERPP